MRTLASNYEDARGRIVGLVNEIGDAAKDTVVPACSEWSVHDLVSHMTGNCADIIAGNVDGVATPSWTARQVAKRRDRTTAEVLAEWDEVAPQVAPLLDDFPGRYGHMVMADTVSHEHDLRGALDRHGARDTAGVSIAVDFLVTMFLHTGTTVLGLDPLEVRAGDREWIAGTGGPATGDLESWRNALLPDDGDAAVSPASPAGTLKTSEFELMRAIAGRRSAAQVRALNWSVDPEPYLPIFGFGPFKLRTTDLDE